MFLIDDLLLAPIKSFTFLIREIEKAAHEERASRAQEVRELLSTLYTQLEEGEIDEETFEEREEQLLDLLDLIEGNEDEDVLDGDEAEPDDAAA